MYGRYGVDEFSRTITVIAVVLSILSIFLSGWISLAVSVLTFLLIVSVLRRTFSKNINKRVMENHKFLAKTAKIREYFRFLKTRFNDRKYYKYIKCPKCKKYSRVPKGKGRIKITCRVCKNQFQKKV
jgi:hypothetical protein